MTQLKSRKTQLFTNYEVENLKTGRKYYGMTTNGRRRIIRHRCDLKRGVHVNPWMQDDYNKGNFEFAYKFLHNTLDKYEALEIEQLLIEGDPTCYNITCSTPEKKVMPAYSRETRDYVMVEIFAMLDNGYTVADIIALTGANPSWISDIRHGRIPMPELQTSFRDPAFFEPVVTHTSTPVHSNFLDFYQNVAAGL